MLNFKNTSVYLGYDLKEFNAVRNLLESAGIDYQYKVNNRQGQFLGAPGMGKGTIRGSFGSLGGNPNQTYEYEIKVAAKDKDAAEYVIHKM